MQFLRYDVGSDSPDKHPQDQMKELGFKVIHGIPQSVGDCWWFCVEDNNIELPSYIRPMRSYSLKYWRDRCHENCEYFKKYFNVETQTRNWEFWCECGEKCFKELNNE